MQRFLLLVVVLLLSSPLCLAQEPRDTGDPLVDPALKEFNAVAQANQEQSLFKVLRYSAPFDRVYHVLWLDREGNAFKARYVTGWAVQASRRGKLNAGQLEEVKRTLAGFRRLPKPALTKPEGGQVFTAVVFLTEAGQVRHDYTGPLPDEVQRVIDVVDTEIERQEELRDEERLKRQHEGQQPKPRL